MITPSERVFNWQEMEQGMFIHFGINTFYNQEWGDGSESPARFNPTGLDAGQWARVAARAGFKYMVLTAKHHDGFCLWPTSTTAHSVKSSPWEDGRGDVVRCFTDACREHGLKAGLYLSPWDRNAACYTDPQAYDAFYLAQLTELLTNYGPLCEVWFDGAGSVGREYNWEAIMACVRKNQPDAVVFNMGRPDIRWVGNEEGLAPYPCWNRAQQARQSMYTQDMETWLEGTPQWIPAECDVPIRRLHWFWHPGDEDSLKTLDELIDIYDRSVGRGCNLLLNLSPDRRGLLCDADVRRVTELGEYVKRAYQSPVLNTGSFTGRTKSVALKATLSHIMLAEEIQKGERVRKFTLTAHTKNGGVTLFEGSAIGHKLIIKFKPLEVEGLCLSVSESEGEPQMRYMQAFS